MFLISICTISTFDIIWLRINKEDEEAISCRAAFSRRMICKIWLEWTTTLIIRLIFLTRNMLITPGLMSQESFYFRENIVSCSKLHLLHWHLCQLRYCKFKLLPWILPGTSIAFATAFRVWSEKCWHRSIPSLTKLGVFWCDQHLKRICRRTPWIIIFR